MPALPIDVSRSSGRKAGLRLLVLLVILVIVTSLASMVIQGRQAARRAQRFRTMESIVRALSAHNDSYGRLPASVHRDREGRPLCSWRFDLTRFVEQDSVGCSPEEYWLDPVNFESVTLLSYPFTFPWYSNTADSRTANVSLVTGPNTPFDGGWWSLQDLDSDTILVVEVADFDYHWMEPGDLKLDDVSSMLTAGLDGKGLFVGFADEQVWFLDASVPLANLKPFFTVDGARQYDREKKLGPYRRR